MQDSPTDGHGQSFDHLGQHDWVNRGADFASWAVEPRRYWRISSVHIFIGWHVVGYMIYIYIYIVLYSYIYRLRGKKPTLSKTNWSATCPCHVFFDENAVGLSDLPRLHGEPGVLNGAFQTREADQSTMAERLFKGFSQTRSYFAVPKIQSVIIIFPHSTHLSCSGTHHVPLKIATVQLGFPHHFGRNPFLDGEGHTLFSPQCWSSASSGPTSNCSWWCRGPHCLEDLLQQVAQPFFTCCGKKNVFLREKNKTCF